VKAQFRNRIEAGELLADKLAKYADHQQVLVLALPRGGVPVALAVARRLHAPLDLMIVRKLGVPGQEELAMGAIASGGVRILNQEVVQMLSISPQALEAVVDREERELARRDLAYRQGRPFPSIRGQTVILVDDGIATGSTVRAGMEGLRRQHAARIILATPVIAASTFEELRREADEVVAVLIPESFYGVGQWYEDFSPTTDQDVQHLMASATPA
jgi:predicted phosphoribosyltransferase